MAEMVNVTAQPVVVEWCVVPEHFDAQGAHSGSGCTVKSHTIPPGAVLSYDDTPVNAPYIASVADTAGLTPGA